MIKRKILGKAQALIAALGLALALVFTGCDNGGSGGGGGGGAFLGTTLELRGQVSLSQWDDNDNRTLTPYTGNRAITFAGFRYGGCCCDGGEFISVGGSGEIRQGQLSFTVGTPPDAAMVNIGNFFDDYEEFFDNFNISNRNTRAASVDSLRTAADPWEKEVRRSRETPTSWEVVFFIYVDTEVTVSGSGRTGTFRCRCEEWDGYCYCEEYDGDCYCGGTFITRSFTITLQPGWNAVRFIEELLSAGRRLTITTGNPANFRWVMYQ